MRLQHTKITEAGFTQAVIAFARLHGWRTLHMRPARTAKGWRTPVAGDGVGFPDLLMCRGDEVIASELKVGKNKLSAAQQDWITALEAAGVKVYCWRETDWPDIESVLRRAGP